MVCIQVESSVLEWNDFMCKFVVYHLLFAISTLSNIKYLWCSSWSNPVEKCYLRTCKRGKLKIKVCVGSCLINHCEPEECLTLFKKFHCMNWSLIYIDCSKIKESFNHNCSVLYLCGIQCVIKGALLTCWIAFLKARIAKGRP